MVFLARVHVGAGLGVFLHLEIEKRPAVLADGRFVPTRDGKDHPSIEIGLVEVRVQRQRLVVVPKGFLLVPVQADQRQPAIIAGPWVVRFEFNGAVASRPRLRSTFEDEDDDEDERDWIAACAHFVRLMM